MLKVLHLFPMNKLSGAERMGVLICKHMTDVKFYVITGGANLANEFEKDGIQTSHVNFSMKQIPQVMKQLNRFITEKRIDIIHAHDNIASLCAYLTKKTYRLDIKVISHIHNCYPWLEGNGIHKCIDRFIRPKYDFNIACGQIVYDYYEQHAPYLNKNKVSILSNAIDMSEQGNISHQYLEKIKKEFNIPSNKIIIGYIGRLSEQKGMIPFIQTLEKYKEDFKKCKFLIIGSGEEEYEIKQLVRDLRIEELFIFTGFQSNVYPFYKLIDIFFLPSLYEGLPMVLLEAISFHCPVVSMNVGSISEIIIADKTGILIEAGNIENFVQALLLFKDDNNKQIKIKREAFKYVKQKYDIHNYLLELKSLYNSLQESS